MTAPELFEFVANLGQQSGQGVNLGSRDLEVPLSRVVRILQEFDQVPVLQVRTFSFEGIK